MVKNLKKKVGKNFKKIQKKIEKNIKHPKNKSKKIKIGKIF